MRIHRFEHRRIRRRALQHADAGARLNRRPAQRTYLRGVQYSGRSCRGTGVSQRHTRRRRAHRRQSQQGMDRSAAGRTCGPPSAASRVSPSTMRMPRVLRNCATALRAVCPAPFWLLTLGTGIGSALFVDGRLVPNTEFGHLQVGGQRGGKARFGARQGGRGFELGRWAGELNLVINEYHALVVARSHRTVRRHHRRARKVHG